MSPRTKKPTPLSAEKVPLSGQTHKRYSNFLDTHGLRTLYRYMLKYRMIDERIAALRKEGVGGSRRVVRPEATMVGAIVDLLPGDTFAHFSDDFVPQVIHEVPLKSIFAQLGDKKAAASKPQLSSPETACTPLNVLGSLPSAAAQAGIATGIALSYRVNKERKVVLQCATYEHSLAIWHELLDFAGTEKLPIVYLFLNRELTGVLPRGRAVKSGKVPNKYPFPLMVVDGNDAVAVYRVAHEAILRARNGGGPTLIECQLMTLGKKLADPIVRMEVYMKSRGAWSDSWRQVIAREISDELDGAMACARIKRRSQRNK